MRKTITLLATIASTFAIAQVGINNTNPQATLDITAKTSDGSKPEGIIAPRLTGDQIQSADAQYTASQAGTLVYATAAATAPAGKTANITAVGYYFFDGSIWQRVTTGAGTNIYNADGSLSADRIVDMPNRRLAFTPSGTQLTNQFNIDGTTLSVDALNNRIGIGTIAPTHDVSIHGVNSTNLSIRRAVSGTGSPQLFFEKTNSSDPAVNTAVISGSNIGGILFNGANGSNYNNTSSAIYGSATETQSTAAAGGALRFFTTPNGTIAALERVRVDQTGFVGINTTTPSERLDVSGNIRFSGALMPNNNAGTSGQVLQSAGAGTVPTWTTLTAANTPNLYSADGTLAANRTVTQGTNTLAFTSTAITGTSHFTVDGSTFNVDAVNNRVGIGTTTPLFALDVRGADTRVEDLRSAQSQFDFTNAAGGFMTLLDNIGLGINKTVPTERLDVVGNIRVSGALMPNNLPGTSGQFLTSAGAATAPTWTTLTAATTPNLYSADGTVAANRTVSQGTNTIAFTSTSTTGTSHFTVDGSTFNVDAANNRVGIGNNAPTESLDVTGNVKFSGALMPNNTAGTSGQVLQSAGAGAVPIWTTLTAANTPNLYSADGTVAANRTAALGTNTLAFTSTASTGTNHFSVDGSTFSINAANNRVGIGTTTPTVSLDVAGSIKFSGALNANSSDGLSGQVLTSNGPGVAPSWASQSANAGITNLTGSRLKDVTYTNSSSKFIYLYISYYKTSGTYCHATIRINGIDVLFSNGDSGISTALFAAIPPGMTYLLTSDTGSNFAVLSWVEIN